MTEVLTSTISLFQNIPIALFRVTYSPAIFIPQLFLFVMPFFGVVFLFSPGKTLDKRCSLLTDTRKQAPQLVLDPPLLWVILLWEFLQQGPVSVKSLQFCLFCPLLRVFILSLFWKNSSDVERAVDWEFFSLCCTCCWETSSQPRTILCGSCAFSRWETHLSPPLLCLPGWCVSVEGPSYSPLHLKSGFQQLIEFFPRSLQIVSVFMFFVVSDTSMAWISDFPRSPALCFDTALHVATGHFL